MSKNKLKKKENQYFLAKDKVTRESQYPYRQKSVLIADKVLKKIFKKKYIRKQWIENQEARFF